MQARNAQELHIAADQGRLFRKALEGALSMISIFIGLLLVLAIPPDSAHLYTPMTLFAPLKLWGILMLAVGVVRLVILIINGYWPHSYFFRKWLSVASLFVAWLPLLACYWWDFVLKVLQTFPQLYPGVAYSLLTVAAEFLVFYAISTFVYIRGKEANE